jgi:hypothetical protein
VQEAAAKLAEEKRLAEVEAARVKAEQQKQKEEEVLAHTHYYDATTAILVSHLCFHCS